MNLNVSDWKPFRIDSIFDIYTGGDLIMRDIEDGNIPIASNSSENNNIAAYTDVIPGRKLFDHTKSISIADRGKFWAFIQPRDFYLATRAKGLVCKDANILNKYQMAFIVSLINQESFKFSYGRNCCANLNNMEISLPVQHNASGTVIIDTSYKYSDEGYIPDWQFMEDYIRSLRYKPLTTKNKANQVPNLNINSWKEILLNDYFEIEAGKYHYSDEYEEGATPYYSASNENNGIGSYIDLPPDFEGNRIVTGKIGCTAFYAPVPFCATSDVNIFIPKFDMSPCVGLFVANVINFNENYKWAYGRQCRVGNSKRIIVRLPVDSNGEPDWQFMENYIKALPYGDRL